MSGTIFVLMGPSGVGKNAVMTEVMARRPEIRQMPTATTRSPRSTEQEGREHFFVSLDHFKQMIANNELIEHQENYPGVWYGTPRYQLQEAIDHGEKLIADIDVIGAQALKKAFPTHVVLIFIAPPSWADLESRLRERGNMPETEIENRLARARWELTFSDQCDYQIVNDDLESAVEAVAAIVEKKLFNVARA